MRHHAPATPLPADAAKPTRTARQVLTQLAPYFWRYKWRVILALACVLAGKLANVGIPILLKRLVDGMTPVANLATQQNHLAAPLSPAQIALLAGAVPVALLLAYGLLRVATSLFNELREFIIAKATQGAAREVALQTFAHLHALSLRFHLTRQTGGITRDIERGVRSMESLISYTLYSILPTLIEVALVLGILAYHFGWEFVLITVLALVAYIAYTVWVTEWRTQFRQMANRLDSEAHTRAVDSLLNHETVKYFGSEARELARYDDAIVQMNAARLKSQSSLALLNTGQQLIIAVALVAMLWRATVGVAEGRMTLGDLVMVNAFMIQLYIPLNFLGVIYREIKQSLTDLDRLFALHDVPLEIADKPGAHALPQAPALGVAFEQVQFAYEPERTILHGISFAIPPGHTVAVVGPSGSGKSTLARLLYRFYDVQGGSVRVGTPGALHDVRDLQQASLRAAIGIVPQDTVLFNDTIGMNIGYGKAGSTQAEIEAAARAAHIHDFITRLPKGYDTVVGERGLKLSGGEKQRVAIARTLLKNPPIVIFDEATSALDSANERAIQAQLAAISARKTTLLIAHRLSTVVHAHQILVMEAGRIIERGTHEELLAQRGKYADMWALQQAAEREA